MFGWLRDKTACKPDIKQDALKLAEAKREELEALIKERRRLHAERQRAMIDSILPGGRS